MFFRWALLALAVAPWWTPFAIIVPARALSDSLDLSRQLPQLRRFRDQQAHARLVGATRFIVAILQLSRSVDSWRFQDGRR